jgi:hypothetical protein
MPASNCRPVSRLAAFLRQIAGEQASVPSGLLGELREWVEELMEEIRGG